MGETSCNQLNGWNDKNGGVEDNSDVSNLVNLAIDDTVDQEENPTKGKSGLIGKITYSSEHKLSLRCPQADLPSGGGSQKYCSG